MFEVCKRCLMPNTRPRTPLADGVCQACINYDTRQNVDWAERLAEFTRVCDRQRGSSEWDCVVPVSGGKDSHAMVHWLKAMDMNPLLVTVGDIFTKTKAGIQNFNNLGNVFNCDHILYTINPNLFRQLARVCFERYLDPLRFVEQVIHTIPVKLAIKLGINMVVYGESEFVYGGTTIESPSAKPAIWHEFQTYGVDFWCGLGADRGELNSIFPLTPGEFEDVAIFWMSHFVPWSSVNNRAVARRYGFKDVTHEWHREGCIEDYEQIDSMGYLAHIWMKYPKFGFQRVSDIASRRLREGRLTIPEAKQLILDKDPVLDQLALEDFCNTFIYPIKDFWWIVDKFYNTEIFEWDGYTWRMKIDRFGGV